MPGPAAKVPLAAGEVRLFRTDLPKAKRKPVTDCVQVLYKRHVLDAEKDGRASAPKRGEEKKANLARWTEFAKALKASLDKNLEPHWHVLFGGSVGFACKKREATLGMWRVDSMMVVVWKSPGYEGPVEAQEAANEDASADGTADQQSETLEGSGSEPAEASSSTLRVLQPLEVEDGTEVATVLAALRKTLKGARAEATPGDRTAVDTERLAQAVRRALHAELGPIWHVVVGSEFVLEPAEDCRNHLVVISGKTKIICFQHEQFAESRIDTEKLMKVLPLAVLVLLLVVYGIMQTYCTDEPLDPVMHPAGARIRAKLCREGMESNLSTLGLLAVGALLLTRKSSLVNFMKRR